MKTVVRQKGGRTLTQVTGGRPGAVKQAAPAPKQAARSPQPPGMQQPRALQPWQLRGLAQARGGGYQDRYLSNHPGVMQNQVLLARQNGMPTYSPNRPQAPQPPMGGQIGGNMGGGPTYGGQNPYGVNPGMQQVLQSRMRQTPNGPGFQTTGPGSLPPGYGQPSPQPMGGDPRGFAPPQGPSKSGFGNMGQMGGYQPQPMWDRGPSGSAPPQGPSKSGFGNSGQMGGGWGGGFTDRGMGMAGGNMNRGGY
jgi:hypothetical protein